MKLLTLICFLFTAQLLHAQNNIDSTPGKVFTRVEVDASFPGGDKAWSEYLRKNLNASVPVDKGAPTGNYKVVVKFRVAEDGTVTDIVPETNNGYGTEEEVVRIIKKSGNWIPAMQNNRIVNAYRRQPVTFAVQDDGIQFISKHLYTFYTGEDNMLFIKADKVNDEDIDVSISNGSIIKKGGGKYIVKVATAGKVIIEVMNTKKKNKLIGSAKFDVISLKQP